MAEAITIACPECEKKLTVAAAAVGKKIRCKGCEHVFVVQAPAAPKAAAKAPAGKPAAGKAGDAKKKAPDKKPDKPKAAADDDEEDSNPYGITSLDTAPRCPECANEMESEEAILCLVCGYNTRTRMKAETRAVEDTTGLTWFLWLLPGIVCAVLAALSLFLAIYSFFVRAPDDSDGWLVWLSAHPATKIWRAIFWLFILFVSARFAVKRLILNPRPPERVKRTKPK